MVVVIPNEVRDLLFLSFWEKILAKKTRIYDLVARRALRNSVQKNKSVFLRVLRGPALRDKKIFARGEEFRH